MTGTVPKTIEESIKDTWDRFNITLIEFNTDDDHDHVLINYPPKYSLSEIVRALKTNSSRNVRKYCAEEIQDKLYGNHFWSPSYFVASAGGVTLDKLKKYVENQGIS